jgi:hypothetical protein
VTPSNEIVYKRTSDLSWDERAKNFQALYTLYKDKADAHPDFDEENLAGYNKLLSEAEYISTSFGWIDSAKRHLELLEMEKAYKELVKKEEDKKSKQKEYYEARKAKKPTA